jgi:hypothetical protein
MRAELLVDDRYELSSDMFVEIVVWELPRSLPGSHHQFKYRLAFIADGFCLLRYDNEAGKGDHRHWKGCETPYKFADLDTLQADFWRDVANMMEAINAHGSN